MSAGYVTKEREAALLDELRRVQESFQECRAERQQAIDERDALRAQQAPLIDKWIRTANGLEARAIKSEDRCEQAIDALREAETLLRHHAADSPRTHALTAYEKVRAALVSLGEAPE